MGERASKQVFREGVRVRYLYGDLGEGTILRLYNGYPPRQWLVDWDNTDEPLPAFEENMERLPSQSLPLLRDVVEHRRAGARGEA
jgi:hypothetical protein